MKKKPEKSGVILNMKKHKIFTKIRIIQKRLTRRKLTNGNVVTSI